MASEAEMEKIEACIKCKYRSATLVVRHAAYCDECLQEQAYHKYRMEVIRSRQQQQHCQQERILLAYSGGASSRLMVHFSQLARNKDPNRPNLDHFLVVQVFNDIDRTIDREQMRREMDGFLQRYSIKGSLIPLSNIFAAPDTVDPSSKLRSLLDRCMTISARDALLRILRFVLLVQLGKEHECSRIFLGDNCMRLAVDIMAETCEGRGMSLPWKMFPSQKVLPYNLCLVRPLRTLGEAEITRCLHLLDLTMSDSSQENSSPKATTSLYSLTDRFIHSLDVATASTVTRTTAKIQTAISGLQEWRPCVLCLAPLPPDPIIGPFCYGCHALGEEIEQLDATCLPPYAVSLLIEHQKVKIIGE